ncbi:hypothetical protein [Thalassotalea euphylliae]|nr:hypothetical protein [Thalassotalea euphylliae]
MAHNDNAMLNNANEDTSTEQLSLAEQLANAQQEIADLKLQLLWMERSYE